MAALDRRALRHLCGFITYSSHTHRSYSASRTQTPRWLYIIQLFIDAHRLVDSFADSAEAWYAVGCYYYLTHKYEKARINFLKATSLNPYFAPAWLGYGHTFAAQVRPH